MSVTIVITIVVIILIILIVDICIGIGIIIILAPVLLCVTLLVVAIPCSLPSDDLMSCPRSLQHSLQPGSTSSGFCHDGSKSPLIEPGS